MTFERTTTLLIAAAALLPACPQYQPMPSREAGAIPGTMGPSGCSCPPTGGGPPAGGGVPAAQGPSPCLRCDGNRLVDTCGGTQTDCASYGMACEEFADFVGCSAAERVTGVSLERLIGCVQCSGPGAVSDTCTGLTVECGGFQNCQATDLQVGCGVAAIP